MLARLDAARCAGGCTPRQEEVLQSCNQTQAWRHLTSGMAHARALRPFVDLTHGLTPGNEASLVARARDGDHQAFELLVRRYKDRVLNLARRIVCDADAAQDVAQEAFIKAYQALGRLRGEAHFASWLYRIAVNQAREHLRAERRRKARWERQRVLAVGQAAPSAGMVEMGPVVELLLELPEEQRIALALFYLRELSVKEIAGATGAPEGTVKAWLSRGRERLRKLAQDRGVL